MPTHDSRKAVVSSLPSCTMATIEALYIFDEHKYVSRPPLLPCDSPGIMLMYDTATSSSTMSTAAAHHHLLPSYRCTCNSPRPALASYTCR